jgi:hypothetical protein
MLCLFSRPTLFNVTNELVSVKNPFGLFLQAVALLTFPAQFPYDALGPELAIGAGVCAGFARVETFPAVTDLHFLAGHGSITVRVKAAFHVFSFTISISLAGLNPSQIENHGN